MAIQKGTKRPRYDNDFKTGAIKLVVEQGRTRKDVASELGICEDSLTNWMKQAGIMPKSVESRNHDAKRIKELESQVRELRKQLSEKDEVVTILKKSVGILSSH